MEENRSFFIDPLFFVVTFGCSDHVLPGKNPTTGKAQPKKLAYSSFGNYILVGYSIYIYITIVITR